MISLKPGVKLHHPNKSKLTTEAILAVVVAESVYRDHGLDCIITSVCEGEHSPNSLHYQGLAVDFRTRHIPSPAMKRQICDLIAEALGDEYDVLLEATHIHVEYDPH